jgi:putative membrane protein insertion efficiency factor
MGLKYMKKIFLIFLKIYQMILSPLKPYATCRFYPTCSNYAAQVIKSHGLLRGGLLSLKRICRCHPWCEGGIDLPPKIKD